MDEAPFLSPFPSPAPADDNGPVALLGSGSGSTKAESSDAVRPLDIRHKCQTPTLTTGYMLGQCIDRILCPGVGKGARGGVGWVGVPAKQIYS